MIKPETSTVSTDWPPPYTLRYSDKAKYIRINISFKKGLELVIPAHYSEREALAFLYEKKTWVEKQWIKVSIAAQNQNVVIEKPQVLSLHAINETWHLEYIEDTSYRLRLKSCGDKRLLLLGQQHLIEDCSVLLIRWLKRRAKNTFPQHLDFLCRETGLDYHSLCIRGQKTRWGSCSKDKVINLNFKLLFLPQSLFHHIIIHELCHTVHMNHSARFWRLVAKHDPLFHDHRQALKQAQQYIPTCLQD